MAVEGDIVEHGAAGVGAGVLAFGDGEAEVERVAGFQRGERLGRQGDGEAGFQVVAASAEIGGQVCGEALGVARGLPRCVVGGDIKAGLGKIREVLRPSIAGVVTRSKTKEESDSW